MNHLMPELGPFATKVPWRALNWAVLTQMKGRLREVRRVVLVDFYLSRASAEVRL